MPANRHRQGPGRLSGGRRTGRLAAHVLRVAESTTEAAFVTDQSGHVVCWNDSAQRVLGHRAADVLGRRCYRLLGGRDHFGNRFCGERCVPRQMARRREPIGPFEVWVRPASGDAIRARCSIVVTQAAGKRFLLLHLLQALTGDHENHCDPAGDKPSASEGKCDPGRTDCGDPRSRRTPDGRLTAREVQVIRLLGAGGGTTEIAATLSVSPTTVRNHIQHAMQKLLVHNRLQAILAARRDSLI